MSGFDIVVLVLAGALVVAGLIQGLVRILIGVAALVAAFVLAARYHGGLAERLAALGLDAAGLRLAAYGLIFVGVVLAGALAGHLASRLARAAMLGWADRLGGAALGLIAALVAAGVVVLPLLAYAPASADWLSRSRLAPYVTVVSDVAAALAPPELSRRYRGRIAELRRRWRDGEPASVAPAPTRI